MWHERDWIWEAYELPGRDPWWAPALLGVAVALFGLLVLLVPRLLEVLIGLGLIALGAWLAYRAWQRRPARWPRSWREFRRSFDRL